MNRPFLTLHSNARKTAEGCGKPSYAEPMCEEPQSFDCVDPLWSSSRWPSGCEIDEDRGNYNGNPGQGTIVVLKDKSTLPSKMDQVLECRASPPMMVFPADRYMQYSYWSDTRPPWIKDKEWVGACNHPNLTIPFLKTNRDIPGPYELVNDLGEFAVEKGVKKLIREPGGHEVSMQCLGNNIWEIDHIQPPPENRKIDSKTLHPDTNTLPFMGRV